MAGSDPGSHNQAMNSPTPQPGVVLVHGAYADGSSWSEVIERLQRAGLAADAVQNPLTSLADDVAHTRRILARHDGPVILAGHSFAGTDFANGVDPVRARVLCAVQGRVSESLFHEKTTAAAWRSKPSWYAISRQDRTISPELQRFLAKRMNATTVEIDSGHLSLITHPQEVTQLILSATQAASQYAAAGGN
jgi:pimeloyl-ACP methyl ester carboxylesterase